MMIVVVVVVIIIIIIIIIIIMAVTAATTTVFFLKFYFLMPKVFADFARGFEICAPHRIGIELFRVRNSVYPNHMQVF
jgi:hypothetical protein